MKKLLSILSIFAFICNIFAISQKYVNYEDFGAKGDGKTDDFEAIIAAHEYANKNNLPVKTNDNATYYIGGSQKSISIKTNTDFGKTKFIIDDREVESRTSHVFRIESFLAPINIKNVKNLKAGQTKFEANLGKNVLIVAKNKNERIYIRTGKTSSIGDIKSDLFIVDKDNNVAPENPILWDFQAFTTLQALPIENEPIIIKGGVFTTIANHANELYKYYSRGFLINRSNVLIEDLEHYVTGEGKEGQPYAAFLKTMHCANITIKDCIFTAHKKYEKENAKGVLIPMGTYDLDVSHALNVTFINCKQSNTIHDDFYWGLMASNFAKNVTLDNCKFSRFDAHRGVFNATILNSEIGYAGINLVGKGTFLMENSTVSAHTFLNLRPDYGSTWEGDIIIKDCIFTPTMNLVTKNYSNGLIHAYNLGNHDYGYTCYAPRKIIVDGLTIKDGKNMPSNYKGLSIFWNYFNNFTPDSKNQVSPYVWGSEISFKRLTIESGIKLKISREKYLLDKVKVEY